MARHSAQLEDRLVKWSKYYGGGRYGAETMGDSACGITERKRGVRGKRVGLGGGRTTKKKNGRVGIRFSQM